MSRDGEIGATLPSGTVGEVDVEDWPDVSKWSGRQRYPAGVEIYLQGDLALEVFFLVEGFVKLTRTDRQGSEVIISLATSNWILGSMEALGDERYRMTATTLDTCSLRRLPRNEFLRRLHADTAFSNRVHLAHGETMRSLVERFTLMASMSVRMRLLHLITYLGRDLGRGDGEVERRDGRLRVKLPLRQWELAQLLATTPEHLSRTLKSLEDEGVVVRKNGWIDVSLDHLN